MGKGEFQSSFRRYFAPVPSLPHTLFGFVQQQISELTSFLNSRGVPYEVREWKVGDYGWVVQPDAGDRPSAGEVGLAAVCTM